MEIWKAIPGFNGYAVSNMGGICSLSRFLTRKNGVLYLKKGKTMKQTPNSSGYMRVCLTANGEKHRLFVHRLVAESFVENPLKENCVNHKDFNPKNNTAENLEWVSYRGNVRYSLERGRYERTAEWRSKLKKTLDERMGRSVIGRNKTTGEEIFFNALNDVRDFGFNPSCVCNCCKGIRKTHKGFEWKYAPDGIANGA